MEQSKARLQSEIEGAPEPSTRLHPNLAELYRKKVASLQDALADPATKAEALEILRSLIDRVNVCAGENRFTIELVGEIANMVRLSTGAESLGKEPYRSSVKLVEGARNPLYRTVLKYRRKPHVAPEEGLHHVG